MGRPPIGKAPMTSAERVRRHREKLRTEEPVKPAPSPDKVAELERELAAERQKRIAAERKLAEVRPEPRAHQSQDHLRVAVLFEAVRVLLLAAKGEIRVTKSDRNKIWKALHPDHVTDPMQKARYDDTLKIVNDRLVVVAEKTAQSAKQEAERARRDAEWRAKERAKQRNRQAGARKAKATREANKAKKEAEKTGP